MKTGTGINPFIRIFKTLFRKEPPKYKGFYDDLRPRAWIVKRARGSSSFREALRAEIEKVKGLPAFNKTIDAKYIVRGNEELLAKAKIERLLTTDSMIRAGGLIDLRIGGRIDLAMQNKAGEKVAHFTAYTRDKKTWNFDHRNVTRNYQGLNLGRVSFRLMEIIIKECGGEKIELDTIDGDVVNTALGLGWNVREDCIKSLKAILGLKRFNKLPSLPKIRQHFREMNLKNKLPSRLVLSKKLS